MTTFDYQTFKLKKDAEAEIAKMLGWVARPVRMYFPTDENAKSNGFVWVVECRERIGNIVSARGRYLRTDGYVR